MELTYNYKANINYNGPHELIFEFDFPVYKYGHEDVDYEAKGAEREED